MHIGVIPDGNRRFMRKKSICGLGESYDMGINKFHEFLEWCLELGVKEVTVYALSLENLVSRGSEEISTLLALFSNHAVESLDNERLHRNGVRVKFCGDREFLDGFEDPVAKEANDNIKRLEEATREYGNLLLNIALAYGGRQEIVSAAKKLVEEGLELSEENLGKHLWIPDSPEIVLRTSECRLSNFMLWQSAYSEIYFVDKLWQELEKEDLVEILGDYADRDRRFGR